MQYFYLIPKDELVYNMVKYSMMSLETNSDPTRQELIEYKNKMRCLIDTIQGNDCYVLVKMGLDFSTPFKGYHGYTKEEINVILDDTKWLHNVGDSRTNMTMLLNGSNTYGTFKNNDLGIYDGFTFALWVKIKASTQHSLFYKWDSLTNQRTFGLDINNGGYPTMYTCENGTSSEYKASLVGKLNIGEWSHLAYTFTSGKVDIILNGVSILADTSSANTTLKQTAQPVYFGAYNSGGIKQIPNADIQEVLVYNTALSESQCIAIKNQNKKGTISALDSYSNLVSWFSFSEFDGTTVLDIQGGNDITMNNTTRDSVI